MSLILWSSVPFNESENLGMLESEILGSQVTKILISVAEAGLAKGGKHPCDRAGCLWLDPSADWRPRLVGY